MSTTLISGGGGSSIAEPVEVTAAATQATTVTLHNAATADGNGTEMDVTGLSTVMFTTSGTFGGGTTLTWQISQDGTNFAGLPAIRIRDGQINLDYNVNSTTVHVVDVTGAVKFRVVISGYSFGEVTVTATGVPLTLYRIPSVGPSNGIAPQATMLIGGTNSGSLNPVDIATTTPSFFANGFVTRQAGMPFEAVLADNTANPTLTQIQTFPMVYDGATWDRLRGTSADGTLVNLGTNNDVTITDPVVAGNVNPAYATDDALITVSRDVVTTAASAIANPGNRMLPAGTRDMATNTVRHIPSTTTPWSIGAFGNPALLTRDIGITALQSTDTLNVLNDTINVNCAENNVNALVVVIKDSGSFVGTITPRIAAVDGVFRNTVAFKLADGTPSNTLELDTVYVVYTAGLYYFETKVTAYTSGSATGYLVATDASSVVYGSVNISNVGQQAMADSIPVVIASDQNLIATETNQATQITQLTSIDSGVITLNTKINTLGQKTSANSTPVVLASDQSAIPVTQSGVWDEVGINDSGNSITVDGTVTANAGTGTFTTKELRSATPAQSTVADNAANVTLLASNANRLGATIANDSSAALYLKLGATASTTSYTARIVQYGYYEVPFGYTGIIDGIWASDPNDGAARVTELTA